MIPPRLETERLILRGPEPRDLEAVTAYFATPRSLWVGGPKDEGQSFRSFAQAFGHWQLLGFGMFAIEQKAGNGAACGMTGPWMPPPWPEGEIGWNLWDEADEGKGIAFEAAKAARDWCYGTLGWTTAVSYINPDNARSVALAKRLGAYDDTDASPPMPGFPDTRIYRHPSPETL